MWQTIVWTVIGILCLAMIAYALMTVVRVNRSRRNMAVFTCFCRPDRDHKWSLGRAVYNVETLDWFSNFSLTSRPRYTWPRRQLEIVKATPHKDMTGAKKMILDLEANGHTCQLMVSYADHSGLVSWVEAAPPRSVTWH